MTAESFQPSMVTFHRQLSCKRKMVNEGHVDNGLASRFEVVFPLDCR